MTEELFDRSEEYERMLLQGISLSGEEQDFFIAERVAELRRRLPPEWMPSAILDYGCGIGRSTRYLHEAFPNALIVGADNAPAALARAQRENNFPWVSFRPVLSLSRQPEFDLCYINGVFHHIPPPEREETVRIIFESLRPSGYCALFENNPWNIGARIVMSRIPFDRDAVMLSPSNTRALLEKTGFQTIPPTRSLFYFPRVLCWLRFAETWLSRLPLGAQYYVLGKKPSHRLYKDVGDQDDV